MNSRKILFLTFFLSFGALMAIPCSAFSAQMRPIQINGTDDGSAVSYHLYKNGTQVCTVTNPVWPLSCTVLIDDLPMAFTIAAVDASGHEGPLSEPYTLVPPAATTSGNYIPTAVVKTNLAAGLAPLTVGFDGSGSSDIDGLIKSYSWSFGDGGTGSGQFIDYSYLTPGSYTATLKVTDDGGATATASVPIVVTAPTTTNQPPLASFTATVLAAGTTQLGFDASASKDPDGTIAGYTWNFGDGTSGSGKTVNHQFPTAGDYTVTLTVADNLGAKGQDSLLLSVVDQSSGSGNSSPVAMISASLNQQLLHFAWQYDPTLTPGLAGFRLYQNHNLVCQIANPAARQADCLLAVDSGQVHLALTAYNTVGSESSTSTEYTFDSTGIFAQATSGQAPLLIHFSSGSSYDTNGTIVSSSWNFGDGTVAAGAVLDHTFAVSGSYLVTLTVTDNLGATAKTTKTITVGKAAPVATNATFTDHAGQLLTGTLSGSDPEKSALLFSLTSNGTLGTATITNSATGAFSYQPKIGSLGTDSFTFKVNNGSLDSKVATVTVQITNNPPVAKPDTATTKSGTAVTIDLLANDTDPDGDPLTLKAVGQGAHGTVAISGTKASYTPAASFVGSDSFTYTVADGKGGSATGTATITVTQAQLQVGAKWSYDASQAVSKFRLYTNGVLACETAGATVRQLQCLIPKPTNTVTFTLTAVDSSGIESSISNALRY